ncbi:alpha/beta hydrolase [Synoicihabitans lomoniglobus]|uniref:Alpha/beta fold hydrolase n=1 Tax=Synoicihabitans lomoniglobus TaxID=2909285 RepID=A0AAF0CR47_9BACT|nr:alpha/beta fold hydrolase [Opitutaceae bacterium LMO-M01]WED66542.1 alpha/beta fold hydrolase [Opitutaceae bacterium LMO-M01]
MPTCLVSLADGRVADSPDNRASFHVVEFPSENATLRGRFYTPDDRPGPWPIVVMAHGYSATINGMVADRYAEQIHRAGFAVLLYDHRNFGISGGEPRQQINVWTQARGYRDAIDFIRTRPEIDPDRIVIWGDSMSGAEVIVVAAIDHRVAGIIAQIPGCGDEMPRADPTGEEFASIRETFLHGNIEATPENTRGPLPVVSFAPAIHPAIMQPDTAFRWFIEYGGRFDTGWENWVTHVTPQVPVAFDPGLCVRHIRAPLLMIVAYEDEMPYVRSDVARRVYELAPSTKQLLQIDGGHFGLLHYPSALFDEASQAQVDFLQAHFR